MNIFYKIFNKVRRSLKGRGIINSILLITRRYLQRLKFRKFDFFELVETHEMDGPEEVKLHATKYEASKPMFFKKMFFNLNWPYQDSTFIDFGCGKGLSLVFASEMGFKKMIGVEFAPVLAKTAVENMKKYSAKKGGVNFEIINIDAGKYEIPSDADCFYFFNPFDAIILDQVMQNINKSLEITPRKILIVYVNALHNEVIEKYRFEKLRFVPVEKLDIYYHGGAYVYTNQ